MCLVNLELSKNSLLTFYCHNCYYLLKNQLLLHLVQRNGEAMPSPRPEDETVMQKAGRKFSQDPLIPLGALATVAFLGKGLQAFHSGQARQAQYLMRGRVLAQGFTVAVFLAGSFAGLISKAPRETMDEAKLSKLQQTK